MSLRNGGTFFIKHNLFRDFFIRISLDEVVVSIYWRFFKGRFSIIIIVGRSNKRLIALNGSVPHRNECSFNLRSGKIWTPRHSPVNIV